MVRLYSVGRIIVMMRSSGGSPSWRWPTCGTDQSGTHPGLFHFPAVWDALEAGVASTGWRQYVPPKRWTGADLRLRRRTFGNAVSTKRDGAGSYEPHAILALCCCFDQAGGWLLGIVFLLCAVGNLALTVRWYARQKHASLVPLIGGVSGALACFTVPFTALRGVWWIPLLLDIGTVPLLALTVAFSIRAAIRQLLSDGRPEDY